MAKLSNNLRGALLMMGSMTGFTLNDAFMKAASDEVPLFQALFMRGLFIVPVLLLICYAMGHLRFDLSRRDTTLIVVRTLAETISAYLFITALFNMPIANVSAILQVLPLTVALGAAVFLKEPLGWRRLVAIGVGFAGVMLIIRPGGSDFNAYSLYVVAAVGLITIRDLSARRITAKAPSTLVALAAAAGVWAMAIVGVMFEDWQPVTGKAMAQLAASGSFVVAAYICSVAAMRVGEIGFVSPFRYTSLVVAIIVGVLVFGDYPDALTLIGAGIVVAMGLFTLYREHQFRIRRAKLAATRA
ncbi:DMT family transporter [Yoonia sp. 208BN28-4]|uniref:DMT family transporter n=1 Tax=Yoonia sp. 208BN28-4 TaxID=3126505 RepID=UPI0030995871